MGNRDKALRFLFRFLGRQYCKRAKGAEVISPVVGPGCSLARRFFFQQTQHFRRDGSLARKSESQGAGNYGCMTALATRAMERTHERSGENFDVSPPLREPTEACSGSSFVWKIYTDAGWSSVREDADVAGLVLGYFQSFLRKDYSSR
jgi:hypothetical protein